MAPAVVMNEQDYPANTFAVGVMIAWLVPRLYIDWNRTLLLVRKHYSKQLHVQVEEAQEQQLKIVNHNALLGTSLWAVILCVSSYFMAKYTVGMDTRMILILGGCSRMLTAGVSVTVSLELPQWLGVYDYLKAIVVPDDEEEDKKKKTTSGSFSMRAAMFDFQWAIMGQFARIYWIVQLFSGGNFIHTWGLPVSYTLGLIVGMGMTYVVYYGRTQLSVVRRRRMTYFIMLFLSVMGCVLCGLGALFIQDVWNPQKALSSRTGTFFLTFFAAALIAGGLHYFAWRGAKKKELENQEKIQAGEAVPEPQYGSELFTPHTMVSAVEGMAQNVEKVTHKVEKVANKVVGSMHSSGGGGGGGVGGSRSTTMNTTTAAVQNGEAVAVDEEATSATINDETTSTPPLEEEQGEQPDKEQVCEACSITTDLEQEPSFSSLCFSKMRCCKCCCAPCGWSERGTFAKLNTKGKIAISAKWFFRFVGHGLCIYTTIVNVGATQQGNYAKELLPTVDDALYKGQEFGPVCAYLEPFEDNVTQSFDNAQAAYDVNYTIAHCGACAACSTWQNLRLQWTTRFNLAILSEKCAKKLIFGGYEKALQCHVDTIGFDIPCSECWVAVEQCSIQYCSFIQMQAWIINNLGNFEVGPDVVTAAMCEEAICEFAFVPCSGANRRRMNIVSDISRPGTQQCSKLVPNGNEKWDGLFGPPDPPIGK